MEHVILVDENDSPLGEMEKMEAHEKGLLHRAFSIFIFNANNEVLIQQRALEKYHSGGLWTNTCCSHPRPGETILNAGIRRLPEEMGFTTDLESLFSFVYHAELTDELSEHELDHVLAGRYTGTFNPNSEEVMNYKWISLDQLRKDCVENPTEYTAWLRIILMEHFDHFNRYLLL